MIGGYVVKGLLEKGHGVLGVDLRVNPNLNDNDNWLEQVVLDLGDKEAVERVFEEHQIDRCIHLAALAHTKGVADTSWEAFRKVNVDCAVNLFEACAKHSVPVLFISTVDAIGMVKGEITPQTQLKPISNYGKSKAMAEGRLKEICSQWNIYRFSPVYTEDVKRDIQKRYYLKYPDWAYLIGGGQQFAQALLAGFDRARAARGKRQHRHAVELDRRHERVDRHRLHVPPDGVAQQHQIVTARVGQRTGQRRTRVGGFLGLGGFDGFLIAVGVRLFRADLEDRPANLLVNRAGHAARVAAPREIGHQDLLAVFGRLTQHILFRRRRLDARS